MTFSVELKELLAGNLEKNVRTVGFAVLALQRMVVTGSHGLAGTPRDTGKAQSNWFVDVGSPNARISDDTTRRNLSMAQATVNMAMLKNDAQTVFYLHNSLPYIKHLEYGLYPNPPKTKTGKTVGGFSTQAPQGFFRLALQRWQEVVKNEIK